jgi:competence protein ComEC
MVVTAIGVLIGTLMLQQAAALPSVIWAGLLVVCAPLALYKPLRFPLSIACGFLWALYQAHHALYPGLAPALEGRDLNVTGVVASIPERVGYATRFVFDIERVHARRTAADAIPRRVRLNWYGSAPDLRLGQRWRITARLKRPLGFMNPGGFDYEGWLYQQGIRATGYVRDEEVPRQLASGVLDRPLGRVRQGLAERVAATLPDSPNIGIITGLAIGERQAIAADQWQLLLATGTNHLLAISGMNISLIAGLVYFLTRRLWRMSARLCLWWPAPRAAAVSSLMAGVGYAALAGFSIPTQRAAIMLAVVIGAQLFGRVSRPGHTLAAALLAVLVWDSRAVISAGFWLSFAAVAIIAYSLSGRHLSAPRWWQWTRLHWIMALGLVPLTLLFFQRAALVAPLANLIAVPWIGVIVTPLALIGTLALPLWPSCASVVLAVADWCLTLLWPVLELLAALPFSQWYRAPPSWTLAPAALGAAWLLAPSGWPARWVGLALLAPLALFPSAGPAPGAYRVSLLDVGQGLSVVVQTARHTLVYDAGPRFSEHFNAGEAAVLPFLRHAGVGRLDTLVISHSDEDHSGGAAAVMQGLPVVRVLTSAPDTIALTHADTCRAGQGWHWDGVKFEILNPEPDGARSDNNRSCVLRIAGAGGAVLLAGDIEAEAELKLVLEQGTRLRSDVLLVPHHGSETSSTEDFIRAVQPRLALASTGYGNRWGFPRPTVVARYLEHNIPMADTGTQGALTLDIAPAAGIVLHEGYRRARRRYWTTLP